MTALPPDILSKIREPKDLKALSYEELSRLAEQCREQIIEVILSHGGHLASNLGVVELTLALHRQFDSPKDRLVWDTSHQCYTHKLVTGRKDRFQSIRTPGGLSGFAEPSESPHDVMGVGHAGTSLSYALGLSVALQSDPERPHVVAVLGDGALTSGTSYEALNNIVHLRPKRLVVVFNDNGWSISENIGWLVHWRNLLWLSPRYEGLTGWGQKLAAKLPKGDRLWEILRRVKSTLEGFFLPSLIWEQMGFRYVGPVDGHDIPELEKALKRAKNIADEGYPVVLHALTQKGRGHELAERNPIKFHQPGTPSVSASNGTPGSTYSQVFAGTLIRLMEEDPKIVGISAAMLEGTGLVEVRRRFPDRVFDVGIAEQHAVTMAAGMAKAGWRPVVAIYSTFLQRSFDQILHDVCLQGLPVTFAIDRAGLVGDDGKTHQGVFDIAFTRLSPGIVVAAPKDENELQHLLYTAVCSGRPFAIRYPRGPGQGVPLDKDFQTIGIGCAAVLQEGKDLTLVAYGSMVPPALEAARILGQAGLSCGVLNARFAKPLDREALKRAARSAPRMMSVEEHSLGGGFGSAVLEAFQEEGIPCQVQCLTVPDRFIDHAPQAMQRQLLGLDAAGIVEAVAARFPGLDARMGEKALRLRERTGERTA